MVTRTTNTTSCFFYKERNMEEVNTAAKKEEDEVILPGFRFHPTDEELVGFYLRRKVEKKLSLRFQLIKEVEIYKYDPWDLPKISSSGEEERYYFCIRGRKYKNSVRPNRVTGSGFWKATGIDKPIYSSGVTCECVGLKKSLVYYRGSAGKGTKTDWMMHEFRLPPSWKVASHSNPTNTYHEAEVWTLCRIFKKNGSNKRYKPALKQTSTDQSLADISSKSSSLESEHSDQYTKLKDMVIQENMNLSLAMHINQGNHFSVDDQISAAQSSYTSSTTTLWELDGDDLFKDGKWDDLRSVVDLSNDSSNLFLCT